MKTQRGVLEDDYELGAKLGSGFYGSVYRGKCLRTGMPVAIKVLPRTGDKEADATVRREVAAMRSGAMHTAITQIYEFYESSDNFYIVMEFVDGGELLDHYSPNPNPHPHPNPNPNPNLNPHPHPNTNPHPNPSSHPNRIYEQATHLDAGGKVSVESFRKVLNGPTPTQPFVR